MDGKISGSGFQVFRLALLRVSSAANPQIFADVVLLIGAISPSAMILYGSTLRNMTLHFLVTNITIKTVKRTYRPKAYDKKNYILFLTFVCFLPLSLSLIVLVAASLNEFANR